MTSDSRSGAERSMYEVMKLESSAFDRMDRIEESLDSRVHEVVERLRGDDIRLEERLRQQVEDDVNKVLRQFEVMLSEATASSEERLGASVRSAAAAACLAEQGSAEQNGLQLRAARAA